MMMRKKLSNNNKKKNMMSPYSSMGREKFTALLTELEAKKQTIMSQIENPEQVSAVRFMDVGSETGKLTPIVVRATNYMRNMNGGGRSTTRTIRSMFREADDNHDHDRQVELKQREANHQREDCEGSSSSSSSKMEEKDEESCRLEMKLPKSLKKRINNQQPAAVVTNSVYVGVITVVMILILLLIIVLFERCDQTSNQSSSPIASSGDGFLSMAISIINLPPNMFPFSMSPGFNIDFNSGNGDNATAVSGFM